MSWKQAFVVIPSLFSPASTLAAMTELEKCMESLIFTFHRYAEAGGDGSTLSKKELKKLLENELPSFLKVNTDIFPWRPMETSAHILAALPHLLSRFRPRITPNWWTG